MCYENLHTRCYYWYPHWALSSVTKIVKENVKHDRTGIKRCECTYKTSIMCTYLQKGPWLSSHLLQVSKLACFDSDDIPVIIIVFFCSNGRIREERGWFGSWNMFCKRTFDICCQSYNGSSRTDMWIAVVFFSHQLGQTDETRCKLFAELGVFKILSWNQILLMSSISLLSANCFLPFQVNVPHSESCNRRRARLTCHISKIAARSIIQNVWKLGCFKLTWYRHGDALE